MFDWNNQGWMGDDANLVQNAWRDKRFTDLEIATLMARNEARGRMGADAINAGDLKKQVQGVQDDLRPVLEGVLDAFGIRTGAATTAAQQYGVPTATISAVTEPQANNMLVMMTRQVNFLARIATNTDFLPQMALAQNMGGGRVVAAPAMIMNGNNNVNVDKEQIDLGIK